MCPALQTDFKQELLVDPYDSFMRNHLQYYGYFRDHEPRKDDFVLQPVRRHHREVDVATASDSDRLSSAEDQKKLIYSLLLEGSIFKSRQIVYDNQEGQVIPRLSEPRDLFSPSKKDGSWQTPQWPKECEVIKEKISHIEWDPVTPEVFYRPTGKEPMPLVASEGTGRVVYEISPAYKGSYFTGSRAGGRRCVSKSPRMNQEGQNSNDLHFESRFESGNLQKATKVGTYEYELTLRTDLYTSKHTQWFYFQVKNTRKGIPYRFTIINLMKSNSLYNSGMKPLLYSQQDATLKGMGWRREGKDIKYYKNSRAPDGSSLYCLTWTFEFPHDNDTCYFAHCYPYTYSDLQRDLQSLLSDPVRSQYCKLRSLCRSLAGNTVYLLTITSPSANLPAAVHKKAIVVTARVHPGETNSSWMMKGFLDFLLSDSPDAQVLRDTFIFKVVPMLNPDGVIVGNYRCSLSGRDLNRSYRSLLKDSFPCIWYTRAMVKRLLAEREVLLYCDFHGHSRKNNVFMYGCNNKNQPETKLHERVFPLMLSKNAPDKFFFKGCKFKVQKSKEGTGRIVMWRQGIMNSYTMESTFGGSTLGNKKGTHFSTQDLKSMGHHFCDTLLDYCDPDSSKFILCLSELRTLVEEEIRKKMEQLGRDLDSSVNLSDISLSDIESSTGGSNSSESDGLPAHLLNLAEKMFKKKKRLRSRKERNRLYQKQNFKQKSKSHDSQDISEPPNKIISQVPAKDSGKGDNEKKNMKVKCQEGPTAQTSQPDEVPAATTVQTTEKRLRFYSRKSNSVKTPMNNRLATSYIGDFTMVDHVCQRHMAVKSHERVNGNRLPLIITVIQKAGLPQDSKDTYPVRQHPPLFDAMLDFSSEQRSVADRMLKREKPFITRALVPTTGIKPYRFVTSGEKQKILESSTTARDLQMGPSLRNSRTSKNSQGSIFALMSSDYIDSFLKKPKKDQSDSVRLPSVSKPDPSLS
ncbi:cytosolic carboxypeptidase 2 [Rhinophrynus dorsalis]